MTTKIPLVLLANTSNAVSPAVTRERLDLTITTPPVEGGMVLGSIVNGATGPNAQVVVKIMVAPKQASMPAAGPEGVGANDWRTVATFVGGIVAAAITPILWRFGPEVAYLQIEMSGNTGQPVSASAVVHAYG